MIASRPWSRTDMMIYLTPYLREKVRSLGLSSEEAREHVEVRLS